MSRWNTSAKAVIRKDMFKVAKQFSKRSKMPTVSKCALMVPATTCLCVKAAIEAGRIDKDTHIVAIEKDGQFIDEIADTLRGLGFRNGVTIVNRCFLTIPKRYIVNNLQNKIPKIDFVYLDLCGFYCPNMLKRFSMLREYGIIADSAPIGYTSQTADRKNFFKGYYSDDVPYYKFSTIPDTQENSINLTDHFTDNVSDIMGERYVVTYGRAYKNARIAAPMITFMAQPAKRLRVFTTESGSKKSYNMGYVSA